MSETMIYQGGQHSWFAPTQGAPVVWSVGAWKGEGWTIDEADGRFEVYYHTGEAMRLSADGMLSIGRPEGYWFNTREWAELCVERLKSLDRAFGKDPAIMSLSTSGNFGIGTHSPAYKLDVRGPKFEPLVTIGQGGEIKRLNLPAMFMIWWRKLLWGEKA